MYEEGGEGWEVCERGPGLQRWQGSPHMRWKGGCAHEQHGRLRDAGARVARE